MELTKEERDGLDRYIKRISQEHLVIPITKGITNSEVFEKVFNMKPDEEIMPFACDGKCSNCKHSTETEVEDNLVNVCATFGWWNEEYRKELNDD